MYEWVALAIPALILLLRIVYMLIRVRDDGIRLAIARLAPAPPTTTSPRSPTSASVPIIPLGVATSAVCLPLASPDASFRRTGSGNSPPSL